MTVKCSLTAQILKAVFWVTKNNKKQNNKQTPHLIRILIYKYIHYLIMHLKRTDKAAKITVITKIQDKSNEKANKMIAIIITKTLYSIERIQKIN